MPFFLCLHSGSKSYIFIASLFPYILSWPLCDDPSTPFCVPTDLNRIHIRIKAMPILLKYLILIVRVFFGGGLRSDFFHICFCYKLNVPYSDWNLKKWVNLLEVKDSSLCSDVDFWHDHCHLETRVAIITQKRHSQDQNNCRPSQKPGRVFSA